MRRLIQSVQFINAILIAFIHSPAERVAGGCASAPAPPPEPEPFPIIPQPSPPDDSIASISSCSTGAGHFERTGPSTVVYTSSTGHNITLPIDDASEGGPWLTILKQTHGAISTDAGAAIVNEIFEHRSTGVIKYLVDGRPYNYYQRLRDIEGFDMYSNLAITWASERNVMHTDFEMYTTYADLAARRRPWAFCNYDDPGVGYPRDCGVTEAVGGYWTEIHGSEYPYNGGGQQTAAFQLQLLLPAVPQRKPHIASDLLIW